MKKEEILITGAAGFVGSRLFHYLVSRGMKEKITAVDFGMFGMDAIELNNSKHCTEHSISRLKIKEYLETFSLDSVKTIIHLSGLSNDPMADYSPEGNEELNFEDTARLADAAKKSGVERFIFASSASVYGFNENNILTESCKVNPISNYASSKWNAEEYLRSINDTSNIETKFIALRKGTIMGTSRRMRFDLVVNAMVSQAYTNKLIKLQGGGKVWRPLVSIEDVVNLYTTLIEMNDEKFSIMANGFEYNVVGENWRISELAMKIVEWFKINKIHVDIEPDTRGEQDKRSYRISSTKLDPYYKCIVGMDQTIHDIYSWISSSHRLKEININDPIYYNLKWVKACEEFCKIMEVPFTMLKS